MSFVLKDAFPAFKLLPAMGDGGDPDSEFHPKS